MLKRGLTVTAEKEMATHSSVVAWQIPWMEEPGGLPSMGSHRVGHDWSDLAAAAAAAGDHVEKEMATHSSVLAWRIPWTEEPGGLPSMGLHSVGHDWSDLAAAAAAATVTECVHTTFYQGQLKWLSRGLSSTSVYTHQDCTGSLLLLHLHSFSKLCILIDVKSLIVIWIFISLLSCESIFMCVWAFQESLLCIIPSYPRESIFSIPRTKQTSSPRSFEESPFSSVQSLSRVWLCNPMDCSTPGFPVLQQLPKLIQTLVQLSWWCHPTISSSVIPFSSCLQSFPASGSFEMS